MSQTVFHTLDRRSQTPEILRKAVTATMFIGLFIVLLIAVNLVHFRFFTVNVVFYSALIDAAVALGLTLVAHRVLLRGSVLSAFELGLVGLICLLGGYAFAISGPTVVDRSLSIYIVEKLAQRGGAIRLDAMEDVFVEEYMPEHRLVDVRLTEQLYSGTITIEDGCVRLTDWGRSIAEVTRFYRTTFLPKNRVLMGEETDALTDPFRHSTAAGDYACD